MRLNSRKNGAKAEGHLSEASERRIGRRSVLGGLLAGAAATLGAAAPARAEKSARELFSMADLRGSSNANELGLRPGAVDDQSKLLQSILDKAASQNKPVFLPPGDYKVSNILLPSNTKLIGVPGSSRLVYSGNGHFLMGENAEHIEITGIVADGQNRGFNPYAEALVRLVNIEHAVMDNCRFLGSSGTGIRLDRSAGRIERCSISGAAGECAIMAYENEGLIIVNNEVSDCANGGILVHRWQQAPDGTIVSGNRVSRIGAANGGTGEWGNGINVFRCGDVIITGNHVSDCAFTAIRSNAGSNVQISSNTCLNSGETAIYSEFEFNGAVINSNVIDGGARGISITNFMQGGRMAVCSGNLIRNIRTTAPYEDDEHPFGEGISAEADTVVTGNVIESASRYGLMLGWGPYLRDVVATSNIIRGSDIGVYVSVVEGVGPVRISGNTISGAKGGAIIGHRWQEKTTGDLANGGDGGNARMMISDNLVS
ncbi:MAG: TIGR03808 family TAT-translocated repetitive protein [Nitratireductor sp.]|nr:TIGR03808 family TAT-translocated repetitive protein [Nitratireductor sp.]MCC0020548.1 TIGR03808 family TAT-translocated repetitive protein [Nitratireductor sp.]